MKVKLTLNKWYWITIWHDFTYEWLPKHIHFKIRTRMPKPSIYCSECGKLLNKIVAVDTGDGWLFEWQHENDCGTEDGLDDLAKWYPFWFGVYCNRHDLEKLGIEVF